MGPTDGDPSSLSGIVPASPPDGQVNSFDEASDPVSYSPHHGRMAVGTCRRGRLHSRNIASTLWQGMDDGRHHGDLAFRPSMDFWTTCVATKPKIGTGSATSGFDPCHPATKICAADDIPRAPQTDGRDLHETSDVQSSRAVMTSAVSWKE